MQPNTDSGNQQPTPDARVSPVAFFAEQCGKALEVLARDETNAALQRIPAIASPETLTSRELPVHPVVATARTYLTGDVDCSSAVATLKPFYDQLQPILDQRIRAAHGIELPGENHSDDYNPIFDIFLAMGQFISAATRLQALSQSPNHPLRP